MAQDILRIGQPQQEKILQFMKAAYSVRDEGFQLRQRLEEVDRAYMREFDYTEEQRKALLANKTGDKTKLQNMQVPMVMEDVETAVGFLANVYCFDYPMFKFVADPGKQDLALQWNTLVGEDQVYFSWVNEFITAFRNTAKYNFGPVEVDWCKRIKYKPVNGTGENGVKLEQMVWEGNRIRGLDPYNLVYDPRVAIHKVHEDGEFIGYIEHMSRIKLKMFLASLGAERLKNDVLAFESGDWAGCSYYIPTINPNVFLKNNNWLQGNFDWTKWAFGYAQDHIAYKNMYTVYTLYARIMPYEFGIHVPNDQTPDIWKLIAVNGVVVYAKPMVNAHDLFPIIIVQSQTDNLSLSHQNKAQAENQVPFQDMVSALWNARLQSARRRVTDRMIYNPLLIDPDHINSPNPSAKIPIRPTAYGRKLEEAVYQIPFQDDNAQYFIQEANGVAEWGMRAQGRNRVNLGQFQKGNKLQSEFDTVMANAGARDRTQAVLWEVNGMQHIKTIIKDNYLQFTPKGTKYNRAEEKLVEIDPIQLRKEQAEFEVGDGLLPAQKIAKTDVMQEFFQTLGASPQLAAAYDLGPMFSYFMKVQGVDKLSKFEKTEEMRVFEQQLASWTTLASEVIKKVGTDIGGKPLMPEDIAKIIGPMPQPPQVPQPQQQGVNPNANSQT